MTDYTAIVWVVVGFITLSTVSVFSLIAYWAYMKRLYAYDIHIHEESKGRVPVLVKDTAKIFTAENGIRKMKFRKFKVVWEPPTLDSIEMQATGRPLISLWRDTYGIFHLVRYSVTVPIIVEDEAGNIVKTDQKEIVFSPDNKSNRFWAVNELKEVWARHQSQGMWEKYGSIISMTIMAALFVFGIVISGYYILQMSKGAMDQAQSCIEAGKTVLGTVASVVTK